jgi:tRNA(fMet)-specific endonuclease VapC
MFLLDTDHISLLARGGIEGQNIRNRMILLEPDDLRVSIISYEEQMRGWLAEIAANKSIERQQAKYTELNKMLEYYCGTPIDLFDTNATTIFQNLWLMRLRVGTMDLKIAAIALANNATLLTRNSSDFGKVPNLQIDDWSI